MRKEKFDFGDHVKILFNGGYGTITGIWKANKEHPEGMFEVESKSEKFYRKLSADSLELVSQEEYDAYKVKPPKKYTYSVTLRDQLTGEVNIKLIDLYSQEGELDSEELGLWLETATFHDLIGHGKVIMNLNLCKVSNKSGSQDLTKELRELKNEEYSL